MKLNVTSGGPNEMYGLPYFVWRRKLNQMTLKGREVVDFWRGRIGFECMLDFTSIKFGVFAYEYCLMSKRGL